MGHSYVWHSLFHSWTLKVPCSFWTDNKCCNPQMSIVRKKIKSVFLLCLCTGFAFQTAAFLRTSMTQVPKYQERMDSGKFPTLVRAKKLLEGFFSPPSKRKPVLVAFSELMSTKYTERKHLILFATLSWTWDFTFHLLVIPGHKQ